MSWANERQQLLDAMLRLDRLGMVSGSSGNASVRLPTEDARDRLYLITPAGITYEKIGVDDMVVVNHELEPVDSDGIPSSESLLHIAAYDARPDISAVIHTHSIYASTQAAKAESIPPVIDEMVVYIGGQIDVSEYGFPGSPELAENTVRALGDKRAALIRNHGMVAVGPDLNETMRVAELVERVAMIYVHATLSGGAVRIPDDAIAAERGMYLMRSGLRENQD
ncbi:MAG: class II aldolase/adducin family protein [Chloroflexi bacterium]|nr:class II aldolase/adducin family protein [Chloroflexota bacterium]